ncbi:MAG: AAA family ATPase [Burkholderiales bacterium]|nr:AAA family ATPase [Burkholderiales bacterium]
MYAPFFGFGKEPFSIAPDPRFLYMSDQHREALAHLLYGLEGGGGFVLLTGEIGAGKTTVCRCFLEQVPAHCAVAYVFHPKLTVVELLQTICSEFGIPAPAHADSVKALVDALNDFLLAAHAQGRQAVLVIDEAQALSADVLEQLRLLTNLETSERKLLQIVLIGQPELRQMLARPELEQLAQRVIARYHLGALSFEETRQYIRHRLAVAGPNAAWPFDAAALARIHALSGGVPRRINLVADRALLGAYAQGLNRVDRRTVERGAAEVLGGAAAAPAPPRLAWAWAAAIGVLIVAAGWWSWQRPAALPAARVTALARGAAASAASAAAALASASATASAPSAAAVIAKAAPTPPPLPLVDDAQALIGAAEPSGAVAWRELALLWNVAIGEGEPCTAVAQAGLACFRSAGGGLPVARTLARPGLLTLRAADGSPRYALLVGLDAAQATLQVQRRRLRVPLATLAQVWRGDYATYWREPAAWRDAADAVAARAWLDRELAAAGLPGPRPLRDRVWAFQIAQGLPPDGRAGPMTLMRLARVAGTDDEPSL